MIIKGNKLTAVKGIYVISDLSTGRLYVGSAYQEGNGIWGRWKRYVETNGTCDNKLLKELVDKDPDYARKNFQWGILQTCPLRITEEELFLSSGCAICKLRLKTRTRMLSKTVKKSLQS